PSSAGGRIATGAGRAHPGSGRGTGARVGAAAGVGALCRALSRERRALPAAAQTQAWPAHAVVAAAHAQRGTAAGRRTVSRLSDPGRDLARGDERSLRHAGPDWFAS